MAKPNDAKDGIQQAKQEGLRYVSDTQKGYTRKKSGKSFQYFDQKSKRITDAKVVERINKIGIPPAYVDVWICPAANGHLQATGRDARGRKQYRYHAKWRSTRDEGKFHHTIEFGDALPAIRKKLKQDLKQDGLARDKVLASVVSLLDRTMIRVGNAEYARDNNSYGLTTLRRKHVKVSGEKITFEFPGKSGKKWNLSLQDKQITRIVKKCADIPGHELFKYIAEDGSVKDVGSGDVNSYLKEITRTDFTAKDFRTWSGTVLAALALNEFEKVDSEAQAKKNIVRAIESVAKELGNTPAICRKCYIHPEILNSYLSGDLAKMVKGQIASKSKKGPLTNDEAMVLRFLKSRLK